MGQPLNAKRLVLTGAVTMITIAGTLYGAGIKTENEVSEQVQKSREITIDEHIASLRNHRQGLAMKKHLVEKQIHDLDARIEERKNKGLDNKRG
ncbi:hypothetical protein P175DRAFT_0336623 [Aspergillus ochraceoroseus IBT 24754]|uniref:Uncharacterized protein n=3 Tax=Aspergillus subgen. Nidulantes TaxID=2720870 RepID=A0A0F8UC09_9EURO|nr:uncharacterized protein P175DRAFT_0336623 [Aspergillus ochraceoroseus IBT 24754]KKK15049.1 hypothetical protein AOCH_002115 [Aspergillus ochraceoroseus]KKK17234.1 hypothetical protein ARAM_005921 [Aspergillus rambellii]PTU18876.1 hypothetical protein P175DRAFT_0336623 [Aspergillus ochraceoroseus IBT 24754]